MCHVIDFRLPGLCIATSLKIPREIEPDTFENILRELDAFTDARVVVLFVNEDNSKRLVQASVAFGATERFIWLASDSWGAKTVPVDGQEWAAVGTVTILPQRQVLSGRCHHPAVVTGAPW